MNKISKNKYSENSGSTKLFRFWNKYFDQHESKYLLFIFAAALLLRIVYVIETQGTPFVQHLFSDSRIYNQWAANIIGSGNWIGKEPFFMSPFYPYFLSIFYFIFGESTFLIRIIQALLSGLNIYLIYLAGRNFHSREVGFISAFITSVYAVFIFYSGAILSETLQVFIISLMLVFISENPHGISKRKWFIIGLLFGLAAVIRANILIFVPVILAWFLIKIKRKVNWKIKASSAAVFFLIGTSIPILPVTVRNYIVGGEFVLLTANGGINFYLGNNKDAIGVFVNPSEFDISTDMAGKDYAEKISGVKMTPAKASRFWYKQGIKDITSNPFKAFQMELKKVFLFFDGGEYPQTTIMDVNYFRDNYSNILKLPLINYFFISLFSIAGIVMAFRSKKKAELLFMFLVSYLLGSILFFVNGRFRLGITPLLIILSAYALFKIFIYLKSKEFSQLKLPLIVVGVFLVVNVFILNKPKYTEYDAYLQLGDIAYEEHDYDNAIKNYNKSLFFRDYYKSYVNLGNAFAWKKDFRNAVSAFNKAIARKPDYFLAHFNLGFAYTQIGELDKAIQSFRKVIKLNPNFESAYRNIGISYYVKEDYKSAIPYFKKFIELSKDEEVKRTVMQDIKTCEIKLKELAAKKNKH